MMKMFWNGEKMKIFKNYHVGNVFMINKLKLKLILFCFLYFIFLEGKIDLSSVKVVERNVKRNDADKEGLNWYFTIKTSNKIHELASDTEAEMVQWIISNIDCLFIYIFIFFLYKNSFVFNCKN